MEVKASVILQCNKWKKEKGENGKYKTEARQCRKWRREANP